jgi:AcrR family transcriptional regulator
MAQKKKTDDEVKTEIIEAAKILFMRYGYFKTTMEDIASAVRKGKSTLYYYYKSKDDVFLDVVNSVAGALLLNIRNKVGALNSASEQLFAYFNGLTHEILNLTNLYNLLLDELRDNNILIRQVNDMYFERDIEFIENILLFGIERKEFLSITPDKANSIARLITLMNKNLITNYLLANKQIEWEKLTKMMSEIILRGIR